MPVREQTVRWVTWNHNFFWDSYRFKAVASAAECPRRIGICPKCSFESRLTSSAFTYTVPL